MAEIGTWPERHGIGKEAEAELKRHLTLLGFSYADDGQERNISDEMQKVMRYNYSDPTIRAIRHRPDLLAYRPNFGLAHWEAKKSTDDHWGNFAIEKDCYEELLALHRAGRRVAVAFNKQSGSWVAAWVQHILINRDMSSEFDRQRARGSRTPFLLISKNEFKPLLSFVYRNRERK